MTPGTADYPVTKISASDDAVFFVLSDNRIAQFEYNGTAQSRFHEIDLDSATAWHKLWHADDYAKAVEALESARDGAYVRFIGRIDSLPTASWDVNVKLLPESRTCIIVMRRLPAPVAGGDITQYIDAFGLALPGMTWTADAAGNVDNVSPHWGETRGRNDEDILGGGWLSVIHPDQRAGILSTWRASIDSGKPYEARFQTRFADGNYRWQLARAEPIRDNAGSILRWVGVNIDIDDERQALTKQRIFEALAKHASDSVVIFGADHRVRFCNAAAQRALEIRDSVSLGDLTIIDFFAPDDRARVVEEVLPELHATGRWTSEFRFRNFRTNTAIPAQFEIFYIYDTQQEPLGIACIMRDLRERMRYEQGFRMLAAAGSALLDTLDYRTILRSIARVVANRFAPCCVIDEFDAQGNLYRLNVAHVDPVREAALAKPGSIGRALPQDHIIIRAFVEGQPQIQIMQDARDDIAFAHNLETMSQAFDSMISVPIKASDGKVLAVLTAASSANELGRRLTRDDIYFLQELAYRAESAIENSRRYERERNIALTLQEAALPRALRRHFGLHVSAEYRPGRTEATIGGDWYDTLALDDGRFLAIVGDVVGNGLRAAVAMSKLRQAMQTAALINPDPNFILDAADQILRLHNENMYATALVAIFDPATHSTTFASAGHHGPMIYDRRGDIRTVECPGMMIGLRTPGAEHYTVTIVHDVSDVVLLYTDGIVEAQRDAELGMRQLQAALRQTHVLQAQNTAEALVNEVLNDVRATDDIAVLALRIDSITKHNGIEMRYRDVSLASEARRVFARYLDYSATNASDLMSAELIFGELLGNVSRHAPGPVHIDFHWDDAGEAVLLMTDSGPGYAVEETRLPGELSESSRGLFLITSFAKSLSVEHIDGKTTTRAHFRDVFRDEQKSPAT